MLSDELLGRHFSKNVSCGLGMIIGNKGADTQVYHAQILNSEDAKVRVNAGRTAVNAHANCATHTPGAEGVSADVLPDCFVGIVAWEQLLYCSRCVYWSGK